MNPNDLIAHKIYIKVIRSTSWTNNCRMLFSVSILQGKNWFYFQVVLFSFTYHLEVLFLAVIQRTANSYLGKATAEMVYRNLAGSVFFQDIPSEKGFENLLFLSTIVQNKVFWDIESQLTFFRFTLYCTLTISINKKVFKPISGFFMRP